MSRTLAQVTRLESRRRLLTSAAEVQRGNLAVSWAGLCSGTHTALNQARSHATWWAHWASAGTAVWRTIRVLQGHPSGPGEPPPRATPFLKVLALLKLSTALWQCLRATKTRSSTHAGSASTS